jgi:succinate dehydrogenase/fumarate reductase cytochrome b subunit
MSKRIILSILYSFLLLIPLYIYVVQYFNGISGIISDYGTEAWSWLTIPDWIVFGSASITLLYPVIFFILIYKLLRKEKL